MERSQLNNLPSIQNADVTNKTCLVRVDFNVPIKDEKITDLSRIKAAKPTIDYLLKGRAKVVLLSHLSRIKSINDIKSGKKSLLVVAKALQSLYPKHKVIFVKDNHDKRLPKIVQQMKNNEIILLENTRYQDVDVKTGKVAKRESKNDKRLAKFWASLGDVYVNDAFATIHRCHASNAGIASHMKEKYLGFLVINELENIAKFDRYSTKPVVSIIGGAKISDKIKLIEKLMVMSDQVIIGGGMANTFLSSLGINVGRSLYEPEMDQVARTLYNKYKEKIILPVDLNMVKSFENTKGQVYQLKKIPNNLMALDVGPKSIKQFTKIIKYAKTIFWNGPTGVSEFSNFSASTRAISLAIAEATSLNGAYSLVGGGDTAAAAVKFTNANSFSFISTGGGATLSVIAGDKLPGIFVRRRKH